MDISIILPTFCENGNIGQLIEAIEANFSCSKQQIEIIVVDDNSPDYTAEVVRNLKPLPCFTIRCFVRTQERGLATAIKYGIQQSKGERVLVMDTDFNHSPDNLSKMVDLLDDHDLVIGSRFVKGGGMEDRGRYYASLLFNTFVRAILWVPVHDNLCGFFAIRRNALFTLDLDYIFRGYGEYFIRFVYFTHHFGLKTKEFPAYYSLRKSGESKSHFNTMIRDYSATAFVLRSYKFRK